MFAIWRDPLSRVRSMEVCVMFETQFWNDSRRKQVIESMKEIWREKNSMTMITKLMMKSSYQRCRESFSKFSRSSRFNNENSLHGVTTILAYRAVFQPDARLRQGVWIVDKSYNRLFRTEYLDFIPYLILVSVIFSAIVENPGTQIRMIRGLLYWILGNQCRNN